MYLTGVSGLRWGPETDEVEPSTYRHDPRDPVMTRGGSALIATDYPFGPVDQAATEGREDVLVFTSEPLQADLEVTGRVRATLFAATDGASTDWIVRLCDVDENGRSLNVVDGILRVDMTPDQVTEITVDLWSTAYVFRSGHRLRVQVTSSNFPRWDRNTNTAKAEAEGAADFRVASQRILHDASHPSRILLPIVTPEDADRPE